MTPSFVLIIIYVIIYVFKCSGHLAHAWPVVDFRIGAVKVMSGDVSQERQYKFIKSLLLTLSKPLICYSLFCC